MSSLEGCVRWRGQQAEYTTDERQIMQQLTVREQAFVHTLKATMDGTIEIGGRDLPLESAPRSSRLQLPESAPQYTDPEDLEFGASRDGKPKRRPKIYAFCWSWRKHRVYKTKAAATKALKHWRQNHLDLGWTIHFGSSDVGGYVVKGANDQFRAGMIHEYDRETKERIK